MGALIGQPIPPLAQPSFAGRSAMNRNAGEKVSVCLLTYNHVDVIESTLKSILEQTMEGYEVIVSDDCSTDGTWEQILEIAEADERIKPVRTPCNRGMAGNANFAVAQSGRPYIALLHHDDLYRNDMLEKWTEVLLNHPDAAFVFNLYSVSGKPSLYAEPNLNSDPAASQCMEGKWLLKHHLFPKWGSVVRGTAMVRRSAWNLMGGMREQFGMLADVDLWMRLAMRWPVGYVPEPIITVRHQRPSYYPDIYIESSWSWRRRRLIYEIHATNRLEFLKMNSFSGRLQWWLFRLRLNFDSLQWLVYGIVRNKPDMISSSHDSVTLYDFWALRLFRWVLSGKMDGY